MPKRNLLHLALPLVLAGLACAEPEDVPDYRGQAGYLSLSARPIEAKPDGAAIKLVLLGMAKDGASLEGDALITAECGLINGVPAKEGGRAFVSEGVGSATYRCDGFENTCCSGIQWLTAKLNGYEAKAALSLREDAGVQPEYQSLVLGRSGRTVSSVNVTQVFYKGSLQADSATPALANFDSPSLPAIGFPGGTGNMILSPAGSLLYISGGKLRKFVPDTLTPDPEGGACGTYPATPEENDDVVSTPGCSETEPVTDFVLSTGGAVYHQCGGVFYDSGGRAMPWKGHVYALGPDQSAVALNEAGRLVVYNREGAVFGFRSAESPSGWNGAITHARYYHQENTDKMFREFFKILFGGKLYLVRQFDGWIAEVGTYLPVDGYTANPQILEGPDTKLVARAYGFGTSGSGHIVARFNFKGNNIPSEVLLNSASISPSNLCSGSLSASLDSQSRLITGP